MKTQSTNINQVNLPYGIQLTRNDEGYGLINSNLMANLSDQQGPNLAAEYVSNALESLLLAMTARGIDMSDPRIALSITDAVEAIAREIDEEPASTVAVIVSGGVVQSVISDGKINAILVDHDTDGSGHPTEFNYLDDDDDTVTACGGNFNVDVNCDMIENIIAGIMEKEK